jgi:hypothetical protein
MADTAGSIDPIAQKALAINLDERLYGTFAEIGAGQEVARWFFSVGGAAGTVAKTMSAYDMTFSDEIYGHASRYVSLERLTEMLDHEYGLLGERLSQSRGGRSCFFTFANTAAALSHRGGNECHAWMGIRFQTEPGAEPSDLLIHARMHDRSNPSQQEAIGRLGVNLCTAAFYHWKQPRAMLEMLLDDIEPGRLEIDWVQLAGPAFSTPGPIDNRLMALHLVRLGFTPAVLFGDTGEPLLAADVLRRKAVLVERGRFAPVTRLNLGMLTESRTLFEAELAAPPNPGDPVASASTCPAVLEVMEITMNNLRDRGMVDDADFLSRVDLLTAAGKMVLVSDLGPFHRLAEYLAERKVARAGIVLGVPLLRELFVENHYRDLPGGILEAFGRLFTHSVRLFVHATRDPLDGRPVTAESLKVAGHLCHLHRHLLENRFIIPIPFDEASLRTYSSDEVRSRIAAGDPSWKAFVEPAVAELIESRGYFGGVRAGR